MNTDNKEIENLINDNSNGEKKVIEMIVPCFNESGCIEPFYNAILDLFTEGLENYDFLITYVNDGSSDDSLLKMKDIASRDNRVRYISLSRNFGKESAMAAGLDNVVGDYVVCIDADLQHPPALIPEMLKAVEEEGYDCATARRVSRNGEGKIKSFLSWGFYYVFNRITAIKLAPGQTDFRLMKLKVAKAIMTLDERDRFTKGIYSWVGFNNKWIDYKNVERVNGDSKWSIRSLIKYSYHSFLAFATTPLRGVIWLGMFIVLIDVFFAIRMYVNALRYPERLGSGFTTLVLLIMFFGGVIITILGMIGEYLARIYLEVKKRPMFIISEKNF